MKSRQSGQVAVEYVLLIALTVVAAGALAKLAKDTNLISGLVSTPWRSISMMAENGVWKSNPEGARAQHPAHIRRRLSLYGDNE